MRKSSEFGRAALAIAALTIASLAVTGCASSGGSVDPGAAGRTPSSAELSGLGRTQVVALLGPADFDRVDGPAEIMQYRNGACTLDVFLYKNAADGETRVTHVEARDANMSTVPGDTCLKSVVRGPRSGTG